MFLINDRAENALLLIVDLTILFTIISLNESRISMTHLTKHSHTNKYCNMPQSYQTQTDSHTHTLTHTQAGDYIESRER